MILDVNTYKYKIMSSYININLIRFEYRGSWFAEVPGQIKEKMPVMWENEYDRKTHILETTWLSKGLDGDKKLGKYQKFQDFFKDHINTEIPIVMAMAKDLNKHPAEVKQYQGVYKVLVLSYKPEIRIRFLSQI